MVDTLAEMQKDELLDTILDTLSVIIFDPQRRVVFANQKMSDLLGYTPTEIIGLQHQVFCFTEYTQSDEYQEFWTSLLIQKKNFQDKIIRKTKQGQELIIEGIYFPILDAQHQVRYVMKIAFDISQREQVIRIINQEILASATSLSTISLEGDVKINELLTSLLSVRAVSERNLAETSKLVQEIKEIEQFLHSIDAVAQKLKLLSFNTALEAARFGEESSGFNVVTDEMKKLATQTKSLTEKINTKLSQVDKYIGTTSSSAKTNVQNIDHVQERLIEIQAAYQDVRKTSSNLEDNAAALSETN